MKEKEIHFDMEDFHEIMPIILKKEMEIIKFEWSNAVVKFEIRNEGNKSRVSFKEIIPMEFKGNDPLNDMVGWTIYMTRLEKIFNNEKAEEVESLIKPCEEKIKKLDEEL